MQRRLPRPSEIFPLIGKPDRSKSRLQRRLERCASVEDVRDLARRSTPKSVFDYTDGGSMSETSLDRSRDAYRRVEFTPHVMRDVSEVDLSTHFLGKPSALPFALAPTGFTRMMHHLGEPAVAKVAAGAGIAYGLSTMGTTSIEGLASAVPNGRRWFQLYVTRDRAQAEDLMRRARANGFDSLILTVDAAVGGIRWREVRNGLTIPPQLTLRTILDMSRHPKWWANVLTTEPLTFASLSTSGGTVGDLMTRVFDPGMTIADIAWINDNWDGPVMVKGVQSLADAVILAELGVDAIVLSNHGGRQIDKGNIPLELLPSVVDSVGDRTEV
jgi:L-lactate dehydrogenase (cytochrome)